MSLLDELASRQRFGMRPGLDAIRAAALALGSPHLALSNVVHVAGTNGKGATVAFLDAALRAAGYGVGRYTSPHLVRLAERFFMNGSPMSDAMLEDCAERCAPAFAAAQLTYFEVLTLVAFRLYADLRPDFTLLETGLGGRLDATNLCVPRLAVITRIGLDHCDWLGDTVEKIAVEKAGIIKPGVPVVLGENVESVRAVVAARAAELNSPFYYAPDIVSVSELPAELALPGAFNRENALTALAALKVLGISLAPGSFARVVWPGRFQRVGRFLIDGAHNPPAARALRDALAETWPGRRFELIAGFCGDKAVGEVLSILAPLVSRAYAVKTANPRSLPAEEVAALMRAASIPAEPCASLTEAFASVSSEPVLVCGSLFLAGEALVKLGAYPWGEPCALDPAEILKGS